MHIMKQIGKKMRKLTQDVFNGKNSSVVVACVDYDGLLKFGDCVHIRYTWASERWRGAEWLEKKAGTDFEPLTMIKREFYEDLLCESHV